MTVRTPIPVITIEEEKASEFADVLRGQVRELAETHPGEGIVLDAHLLGVSMEYLEDQGGVSVDVGEDAVGADDFVGAMFKAKVRNTNVLILGYLPISSDGQLTLFTARYGDDPAERTLAVGEFRSRIEQAYRFFRLAYNEPELFADHPQVRALVDHITDQGDRITELRVVFVTNLKLGTREYDREARIGDIDLVYDVYDVERLYKLSDETFSASDIIVDFNEILKHPAPCLEATGRDLPYKSYLLILNGTTIHWLFKRYGPRLYDTNLRSYLDNKTKVNKDIIKTVREQPDRFLAYNNGLTATAREIEVSTFHGQPCISRIVGLQIVNGAQTTGSIYKAIEGLPKSRRGEVDLSQVSVAVKLTKVVGDDLKEFVPRITRYANTQNPIQAADLEANEELHRRIEQLANDIWTPGTSTRWFYERTRGSYQAAMNREGTTPKRKADFKLRIPREQRLGKTDLAKFWMLWNRYPHLVSKGAQKNFDAFKKIISSPEDGIPIERVDEKFFRDVVSMAILFREAGAAVAAAGIGGGIGSMVKAYLTSYLSQRIGDRIALDVVWQHQGVSTEMRALLDEWTPLVLERMKLNAGDHVTEWFKKENCWLDVRGLELDLPATLPPECAAPESRNKATIAAPEIEPADKVAAPVADEPLNLDDDVAVTKALSSEDWYQASKWAGGAEGFSTWDQNFALDMAKYANAGWPKHLPSVKQARTAARIARGAMRAGVLATP